MLANDFLAYLAGQLLHAKLSGRGLTDKEVFFLLEKLLTVDGAPDIDAGISPTFGSHPNARC